MKTLHLYLTKEVLYTVLMTVAVFTFVLLLGNVLREILTLLVNRQATFGLAVRAIGLLIPFVLSFALPMGLLTATLLVFGRFSASQELTAVRASGISLVSLVTPLLLMGVALSVVCALFNMSVAPRCRIAYKRLILNLGIQNPRNFFTEDRFIDEIPGLILYARKKDGDQLKDVRLYELQNGEIVGRFGAPEGELVWETNRVFLRLKDAIGEKRTGEAEAPQPLSSQQGERSEGPLAESARWQLIKGDMETPALDLGSLAPAALEPRLSEMSFQQLRQTIAQLRRKHIDATPALVQLHRQLAFSFASFGFALIGIPLGIKAHRKETMAGGAIALILVLIYYSFFILSHTFEQSSQLAPHLWPWVSNVLFQGVGAALLWKADRSA